MKTSDQVSAAKLRGGFYTPPRLVQAVLHRVEELSDPSMNDLDVLEPSAGNGAFLRGVARGDLGQRVAQVVAVELIGDEAAACQTVAESESVATEVVNDDFLRWRLDTLRTFDVAVGNPPFVRFQFVSEESKSRAAELSARLDVPSRRVSNLWISVLLGALSSLKTGGVFSFVVPAEIMTGSSARSVRQWLLESCEQLTIDLFPPGSFPEVLQEVVVLSGRRRESGESSRTLSIYDHGEGARWWSHTVDPATETWTGYLLSPTELDSLDTARRLAKVAKLGDVVKFEVSAVTGANSFFSIPQETMEQYQLQAWCIDLLPRIRHAPGLIHTHGDQQDLREGGQTCSLLDFSSKRADPRTFSGPKSYLEEGEEALLHTRYKTRIREPWYRVPYIKSGELMLSKRSHWYPRVVVNAAEVVTTDTIYRGDVLSDDLTARDVAASFHNSLTLLSAEIEGRSFGGGVLELVPAECARLDIPLLPEIGVELERLDEIARTPSSEGTGSVIAETNAFLVKADIGLKSVLLDDLEVARSRLLARRLERSSSN